MYNARAQYTMPEHYEQYKVDHFNTLTFPTLVKHSTKVPEQSVPCIDLSGQSELNTTYTYIK